MKRIVSSVIICALLGLLTACNTVQGIGKDVSQGGKELQRAAS